MSAPRPILEKHLFLNQSIQFYYQLYYSAARRRTIQISIESSGVVRVTTPRHYSIESVEDLLIKKASWIERKILEVHARRQQAESDSALSGCLYLGRFYSIDCEVVSQSWGKIDHDDRGFFVKVPENVLPAKRNRFIQEFLLDWFKARANLLLKDRVKMWAEQMGVSVEKISVRAQKRLWGSCHPLRKTLQFNYKILMAPLETLDYVVIHELSHLKEANHSRHFWAVVARYCPGFKEHHRWLKNHGARMHIPENFFV